MTDRVCSIDQYPVAIELGAVLSVLSVLSSRLPARVDAAGADSRFDPRPSNGAPTHLSGLVCQSCLARPRPRARRVSSLGARAARLVQRLASRSSARGRKMSGSYTRTPHGSPSKAQSFKIDPQTGNVMCKLQLRG